MIAKIKQSSRDISSLRVGDQTLTDPEVIANHITSHFKNLFSNNFAIV